MLLQHWILLLSPNNPQLGVVSALAQPLPSFWSSSPVAYWTPSDLGAHLLVSYLFAFFYSSWGSHSYYTGVFPHSHLQWITLGQNAPLWPFHWVAQHSVAHSFIELHKPFCHDKAVIREGVGNLWFQITFKIICSNSVKNDIGNLIGIGSNLLIALGSISILTIFFQSKSMVCLSIFFESCLTSFINIL